MAANIRLDFLNASGAKWDEVTDCEALECTIGVNQAGLMTVNFLASNKVFSELAYGHMVELWRADDEMGIEWYRHFGGFYVEPDWTQPQKIAYNQITVEGYLSMLRWRVIAYPAGTEDQSMFSSYPAESIMKTLVQYNCTADAAVVNGRLRAGAISGVSVDTDLGRGGSRDWACFSDVLLDTLQDLAATYKDGDFALVRGTGAAWTFYWYPGQLGTDHSADVVFSMGNANMGNPRYKISRRNEKTVCIVGGQGDEAERTFTIVTGSNYSASNNREMFINGSGLRDDPNTVGSVTLQRNQAVEDFTFDLLQTPETMYKKHYDLGDLVTAINPFGGASIVQQINTVKLVKQPGAAEQIVVRPLTR